MQANSMSKDAPDKDKSFKKFPIKELHLMKIVDARAKEIVENRPQHDK